MGGIDKTAIEIDGIPIVDRVTAALRPHCDQVVVVGRDVDGGPAAAVASLAGATRDYDVVVVAAGDLALLRPDHVAALIAAGGDAAAALDDRGAPNPLLVAHRAAVLREALVAVAPGDRADTLLPRATVGVPLDRDATFNVNTPDDLEEARRRLSR